MLQADELNEARRIVEGLGERCNSLPRDDWRFYLSWRQYLTRVGDAAVIGKYRLAILQKIGALHGLVSQDVAAAAVASARGSMGRID